MAAWDVAAEAVVPAPRPRPKPAAQKRPRPAPRRRVTGGVVWIVFVAVLLTGIVALNVAVLRLNVKLDRLSRERTNLRAENTLLQSQLSSAASVQRIQKLAGKQLGLRPADQNSTLYVNLARGRAR